MTDSVDSLHPGRVRWPEGGTGPSRQTVWLSNDEGDLYEDKVEVVPADAYRELWKRFEARAEVGYAVQAESLRKQLEQQRETFDRIVARERDAREKAETERDGWRDQVAQLVEVEQAAEELAEAALARLNSELSSHPKLAAALARFRDTENTGEKR